MKVPIASSSHKGSDCEFPEIFFAVASDCELLRGPSDCELGPTASSASQWSPKEVDCELVSGFLYVHVVSVIGLACLWQPFQAVLRPTGMVGALRGTRSFGWQ